MQRRTFLLSMMAMSSLAMTGCVTNRLLDSGGYYTEEISSLFISKDGKTLVAVTQNYHYIFEAPKVVVNTLQKSFHQYVSANFSDFHVDENEVTKGRLTLTISDAPEAEIASATSSGYKKYTNAISANCDLIGKRYKANGAISAEKYVLNHPYKIFVTAPDSTSEKAAKLLLSPITIAVDGVLILFGVPLMLLGLGIACKNGCS